MQVNSNLNDQSLIFNGLGTFTTTMTQPGDYVVQVENNLPLARDGYYSQLQTVIKQNSSTKLTSAAGASGAKVVIKGVAVGDTISVVTSSAQAADNQLNAIKTQVYIYQGDN
jgi:hypothetical protein